MPDTTAPTAAARQLDDTLFVAVGLAWSAGLIHLAAAIAHLQEYVPYAICFELVAVTQLAWGVAAYRAATPKVLWAGAAMSLAFVAVWIASRTTGLPFGPAAWQPEAVGALDAVAVADELALAVLVILRQGSRHDRPTARRGDHVFIATGIALIVMSSLVLALGDHSH